MEENRKIQENQSTSSFITLLRVANYRKKWTIPIYIIVILLTLFITYKIDKKYISEATIMVDKTSSTNLADINPYIIEKMTNMSSGKGGIASILSSMSSQTSNELDIIKSPRILDPVIKKYDLKFGPWAGKKAGKFFTAEELLKIGGLELENRKDSNIVKIKFKSKNPKLSHDVVEAIIKSYTTESEKINTKKASKDKKFLSGELKKSEAEIQVLSEEIKKFSSETGILDPDQGIKLLTSTDNFNPYRRDVAEKLAILPQAQQRATELKIKLKGAVKKYEMIKERYEWAFLVEQMAKDATNITILKKAELKEDWDKAEPKISINLIIGIILCGFLTSFFAFYLEYFDPKLAFMTVKPKKTFWLSKKPKKIFLADTMLLLEKHLDQLGVNCVNILNFGIQGKDLDQFEESFKDFLASKGKCDRFNADEHCNPLEIFKFIENSESILMVGKIGSSNKDIFLRAEEIAEEKDKLLAKIVLF